MADDNKPLKYMRYAIGEIVLVVIGILIALQINTWNEGRKNRIKKVTFQKALIEDLKKDTSELKYQINQFDARIEASDEFIQKMENGIKSIILRQSNLFEAMPGKTFRGSGVKPLKFSLFSHDAFVSFKPSFESG